MGMFKKATKEQSKIRLALIGTSGSGKTYSALSIGSHMGQRIAVLDTEHGSASKYADLFSFDVVELKSFSPEKYIEAIKAAEADGYDVLIIDSLSHAWSGKDGALELVDRAAKRTQRNNTFEAWSEVTPLHNEMVETILSCRCHVIVTMRAKTEYVLEPNNKGKMVPRKVGLAPIQRENLDYEFDVTGIMSTQELIVEKSRCPAMTGGVFPKPGAEVAKILLQWLTTGAPPKPVQQALPLVTKEALEKLRASESEEELKAVAAGMKGQFDVRDLVRVYNEVLEKLHASAASDNAARQPGDDDFHDDAAA